MGSQLLEASNPSLDSRPRASANVTSIPRQRRSLFWVPLALTILGMFALGVDLPLAAWLLDKHNAIPDFVHMLLELAEVFAHGLGVGWWLIAVYVLDPSHRRCVPRLVACSFGAGIFSNFLKLALERTRPYAFDFQGTAIDTFGNWLPLGGAGSAAQSFASGHTATAAGLAVAMTWLYPHGRWMFVTFATMAALQRLDSGSHYLSDICWGAAVGTLVAGICTRSRQVSGWFDRREKVMKVEG